MGGGGQGPANSLEGHSARDLPGGGREVSFEIFQTQFFGKRVKQATIGRLGGAMNLNAPFLGSASVLFIHPSI